MENNKDGLTTQFLVLQRKCFNGNGGGGGGGNNSIKQWTFISKILVQMGASWCNLYFRKIILMS